LSNGYRPNHLVLLTLSRRAISLICRNGGDSHDLHGREPMMTDACQKLRLLGWLVLGLAVLLNAGCLVAAIGAAGAAGAAVAGYAYCNGLLYRDYPATLSDSMAAVRTSLMELHFPIVKEKTDTGTALIQTRTGDDHAVRIYLDIVPSPIPAEGALTRIGIRVGFSGDEAVSARILDQVSRHLVAPGLAPVAASGPGTVVPGSPPPVTSAPGAPATPNLLPPRPVAETGPPPLAGR
jgi:hypothetical protein